MFELTANVKSSFLSTLFSFLQSLCAFTLTKKAGSFTHRKKKTQIQVTFQKINTLALFEKTKYLHGIVHRRKIQIHPPSLSQRINYNNYNNY